MSDAHDRPFVDTNVLLYLHDRTAGPKRERALELLGGLVRSDVRLCLSVQVLQQFYVNATRKLGMQDAAAYAIVADLAAGDVHAPGPDDVLAAIDLHRRHRISFWDSMIVRSASQLGCDVVWTEDLSHGRTYDGVVAHNPFVTPTA